MERNEPTYEVGDEHVAIQRVSYGLEFNGFDANGFFDGPVTPEGAKRAVSKIKALEEMLKAADKFAEHAMRFCLAEAQVYVEISRTDGAEDELTPAKQRLVRWIRGKSNEQLDAILEEVAKGVRITVIERRENADSRERFDPIEELETLQARFIEEAVENGMTQVNKTRFYEESKNPARLPKSAVDAYRERTRDKLIRKGFKGLGDGKGTMLDPSKCERSKVAEMVRVKLKSIEVDLRSIKEICLATEYVVPRSGVKLLHSLIDSLEDDSEPIALDSYEAGE